MLKLSGAWLCGLSSVPKGSGLSRLRSSVLKYCRGANDVEWEDVELMFARGPKTYRPELRLNLPSFRSRQEFWGFATNVGFMSSNGAMACGKGRVVVQCVNVQGAIIQSSPILEIKRQGETTIATGELEAARGSGVLAPYLSPVVQLIR